MSFSQPVSRRVGGDWAKTAAKTAADTAPTLVTHGTAITGAFVQYGVSDLTAVTDYALQLWVYCGDATAGLDWAVIAEHLSGGATPRVWECAVGSMATRYLVVLSSLTGTNLKLKHRQV